MKEISSHFEIETHMDATMPLRDVVLLGLPDVCTSFRRALRLIPLGIYRSAEGPQA